MVKYYPGTLVILYGNVQPLVVDLLIRLHSPATQEQIKLSRMATL